MAIGIVTTTLIIYLQRKLLSHYDRDWHPRPPNLHSANSAKISNNYQRQTNQYQTIIIHIVLTSRFYLTLAASCDPQLAVNHTLLSFITAPCQLGFSFTLSLSLSLTLTWVFVALISSTSIFWSWSSWQNLTVTLQSMKAGQHTEICHVSVCTELKMVVGVVRKEGSSFKT